MKRDNLIPATVVYRKYGIPRAMLRALSDNGIVRKIERSTGGPFVMKMYNESDILNYCNGN